MGPARSVPATENMAGAVPSTPPLSISVNLSGKQFSQPDLIECISEILKETGLDASSLKIEITESAIIENLDAAVMMFEADQGARIRLSLDDFGTGYSSLSYLHRFSHRHPEDRSLICFEDPTSPRTLR